MARPLIAQKTREKVIARSGEKCEYCLDVPTNYFGKFHIEHIVAAFHGGPPILENLAYSCDQCNLRKGISQGSYVKYGAPWTRYFNPRTENWFEHFGMDSTGLIIPKTEIGQVTMKAFRMNDDDRVQRRGILIILGFIKLN